MCRHLRAPQNWIAFAYGVCARARRVNWMALYFGVFIVILMIYFCCHFKWAHWIDFLSLFALRPQNDHSYYHVAKAIINNKLNNQLHIGDQSIRYFHSNTTMFCKQRLTNLCADTFFFTTHTLYFSRFHAFCSHSFASFSNSIRSQCINIQVESLLTLSYNNPLAVCLLY